ncbi:hypothetical protein CR161_05045 [Prosthecochloris sp. ZM]|uniref:hypothetical protein n=1 Tax=Prosthecochloris sp. ZM TaxID=2283143 RepID=UPI000DF84A7C|nr:hypothetical protein [Prosthecochloris sp. ZM]RDD30124.1 hypothetical protein CR161_05045 [Prosthecochloris sp. ZM]
MQAEKHLFSTTALVGRFLRNRAVERLFSGKSREAAVVLADALEKNHPEADAIFRRLLQLRHDREPVMHTALWNYWKSHRFEELLKREHASASFQSDFLRALEAMPESDWGNGLLFAIWSQLDRDEIADIIESGGRHAPALEMDALFGLVRSRPERYLNLEDPDYSIFEKAWLAASAAQRQRISLTVLNSQDPRLIAAYDHAVRDQHDPQLVIEALKLCGDHDLLFERLQGLQFNGALEVIAFWAESGVRPKNSSRAAIVEQAVALYRELAGLLPGSRSVVPQGTRDLFSFWVERYQTDESILQDLSGSDPFRRAGALYCGAQRGVIPRNRVQEISVNGTWLEKLALQYLFNAPDVGARNEHVLWLRPQDNVVAGILSMRLPGTLEESSRLSGKIQKASGGDKLYLQKLLQLLTLLQGYFLRGLITVDSSDDASEHNAVETEEVTDVEW